MGQPDPRERVDARFRGPAHAVGVHRQSLGDDRGGDAVGRERGDECRHDAVRGVRARRAVLRLAHP